MTREKLQQRLQELQKQLEQAKANANAVGGAIQDCEYWLAELDKAEAPPEIKS